MAILLKIMIMSLNCSKYATLCEKIAVLNTFWIFLVYCETPNKGSCDNQDGKL